MELSIMKPKEELDPENLQRPSIRQKLEVSLKG